MSMVPFAPQSGNEMLKQFALSKLMQDPAAQAESMTLTGTFAGASVSSLRDNDNRSVDGLARRMEIIENMKVSDEIKAELQLRAMNRDEAWGHLLMQTGGNISSLVR